MSLLLSIDTAGTACAVAISRPGELLAVSVLDEPRMHASRLAPMIRDTAEEAGVDVKDVEAVAVSKGPGSFTGLRIGVSSAKGLAFGLGTPLVGVATFEAMAIANRPAVGRDPGEGSVEESRVVLVTTAPSRRREAYWQPWRVGGETPSALAGARSESFQEIASRLHDLSSSVTLIGEAARDLHPVVAEAGIAVEMISPVDTRPTIYGIYELGHEALERGDVEDVASFEPFYLKEFVAKKGGSPFERLGF